MNYSMIRSAFSINFIPLRKKNNITKTESSQTWITFKQGREMESTIPERQK